MDILTKSNDNYYQFFNFENMLSKEYYLNYELEKVNSPEKNVATTINNKLEKKESYSEGLILLEKSLTRISDEIFIKYFSHWTSKVLQILVNSQINSNELRVACKTTATLITKCKQIPELDKGTSIHNIKQIVLATVKQYEQDRNRNLLNMLSVLLYHYPESCARFQAYFNKIVTSCIDEKEKNLVYSGAKVYSLLVRLSERQIANSCKDNFTNLSDSSAKCHILHQINLCNNLHILMNELFQDLITTSILPYKLDVSTNINRLELQRISCEDILEYYTAIENRFHNICIYLSTLLKIGGNGKKKYTIPNIVLQIVLTGLEITPENLQKNYEEKRKNLLILILPKLHASLLHILTTLIMSFQQELLSDALRIQGLILQILQWTRLSTNKFVKNLRRLCYKTLSIWLREVGDLSGFQILAEEFFIHILQDLMPSNKNITNLPVVKNIMKKKNLVESYHISLDDFNSSALAIVNDSDFFLDILYTIQSIILSTNGYLKHYFYNSIKSLVLLLLHEQYIKNSIKIMNVTLILELLKTLRLLQTYAHSSVSSPTSYAIQIFTIVLSQENNTEIVNEANLGLSELYNIINPTAPTLMLLPPRPILAEQIVKPSQFESINVSAKQNQEMDNLNSSHKRIRCE